MRGDKDLFSFLGGVVANTAALALASLGPVSVSLFNFALTPLRPNPGILVITKIQVA
jgi:hypothetical protein